MSAITPYCWQLLFYFYFNTFEKRVVGYLESSAQTPLLRRGGESRRGSGGWGGAGQENHSLDQHHPVCAGLGGFATFPLPRSHPSSAEEGSFVVSKLQSDPLPLAFLVLSLPNPRSTMPPLLGGGTSHEQNSCSSTATAFTSLERHIGSNDKRDVGRNGLRCFPRADPGRHRDGDQHANRNCDDGSDK